jgi:hypothetical protein
MNKFFILFREEVFGLFAKQRASVSGHLAVFLSNIPGLCRQNRWGLWGCCPAFARKTPRVCLANAAALFVQYEPPLIRTIVSSGTLSSVVVSLTTTISFFLSFFLYI